MVANRLLVEEIRGASRALAREWGFMGGSFAGTELSPSAVHALIEIERGGLSARELGVLLRLEKSSVSRMLRKLIDAGEVCEQAGHDDARVKLLSLTPAGRKRVAAIHAFARRQVTQALARLQPGQEGTVVQGLRLYTQALGAPPAAATSRVEIERGYRPGLIARITELHVRFYAREWGLGQRFESYVAGGLAEFCERLAMPRNAVFTAVQQGEIVGSVAVDGESLGAGIAQLRWFIVGDGVRGGGIGRQLLSAALAFADAQRFAETQLWTFGGLAAARHLYESQGFVLAEEMPSERWETAVVEQRFVRRRA